jgi:hypothetical protein
MFSVGDTVAPFGMLESWSGRVTAVWPGIGMVDVETAAGNKRYPAESLQEYIGGNASPPETNSTPGGDQWVSVPAPKPATSKQASAKRVANEYRKRALFDKGAIYWAGPDRQYRRTRSESECGSVFCPRCKEDSSPLERAIYKRRGGKSDKLLGCKLCLFLIKESDILNFESEDSKSKATDPWRT